MKLEFSRSFVVVRKVNGAVVSAKGATITLRAGKMVADAGSGEGIAGGIFLNGKPTDDKSLSVMECLLPVRCITRQSRESETTVAVPAVGLTNQRPIVKLDSVSPCNVNISYGTATVQVKELVRDAIADNDKGFVPFRSLVIL